MEKIVNKFLLIALGVGVLFGGLAFLTRGDLESAGAGGVFTFPLLEYLDIDLQRLSVVLIPYDEDEITVEYKNDRLLDMEIGDNKLIITESDKLVMSLFTGKSAEFGLKLYLPRVVYRDISIYSATGNVNVGEIDCKKLGAVTESGDINIQNMGYLASVATTSGNIRIDMGNIVKDTDILNRNGDIELTVPSESSFAVDFKTESGELETNLISGHILGSYLYQFNGGKRQISVTAQHGTLVLRERT